MFKTDLLWQNDKRWAGETLGFGPPTIKDWGCLMTSMTMVANGFGYNETPKSFNEKMKAAGGFQGAIFMPAAVPAAFPGVEFLSYDECERAPAPIDKIDAALADGQPVIVQVDWSPNPGLQSHWVIAYAKEGDDYLIYDPYKYTGDAPGVKLKLLDRYKHSGTTLSQAISAVIFLRAESSGDTSPEEVLAKPKERAEVPREPLIVYPTADDLAFRAEPAVSGALIRRFSMDTPLTSLERKTIADAKIGQYNQWLNVQDPEGDQGYVAAWYLATTKGEAEATEQPKSKPAPAVSTESAGEEGMVVTPTTDGLAFRRRPSVSGELIKRLPFTARLQVLDPPAQAAGKLGHYDQWIRVRDIYGDEGYAAAWYLTTADNPALGVKEANRPAPTKQPGLVVRSTTDLLALRGQPVINDSNLIKRLPLRAELLVLEEGGEKKIGVVNEWLQVRDLSGAEGYVAAWYVSR
jgi:SH3-like domain-containing protein